jgi:hypothetical protein
MKFRKNYFANTAHILWTLIIYLFICVFTCLFIYIIFCLYTLFSLRKDIYIFTEAMNPSPHVAL